MFVIYGNARVDKIFVSTDKYGKSCIVKIFDVFEREGRKFLVYDVNYDSKGKVVALQELIK